MVMIVWYHTNHPAIMEYPFYMPTLFFVSGMLLHPTSGRAFWTKKVRKLLIPFAFFYIVYYIFLLLINFLKFHSISSDIAWTILDVFQWNVDNDGYTCNYPLWFIWALLWTQIVANYMVMWVKKDWLLFLVAFTISIIGYLYIKHIPTPFILGRSTSLFVFFIAGYLVSKMDYVKRWKIGLPLALSVFVVLHVWDSSIKFIEVSRLIVELTAFAVILLYITVGLQQFKLVKPLMYIGVNSMVVFGMHDMYLSILRIFTQNAIGEMNVWLGVMNTVVVLIMMVPTIYIINKYIPVVVGNKKSSGN